MNTDKNRLLTIPTFRFCSYFGVLLAFLILLGVLDLNTQSPDRRFTIERGLWSRDTVLLTYYENRPMDEKRKEISVPSPNAKLIARVEANDDGLTELNVYQKGGNRIGEVLLQNHPEMSWAPDSKAFFINETDGNSVNGWSLRLFVVGLEFVQELEITANFQNETTEHFKKRPWTKLSRRVGQTDCDADDAGVKWMGNSARLLVIARIPNNSRCRNMSEFRAYVISVPSGQILKRISEPQFKKSYWKQTETMFP